MADGDIKLTYDNLTLLLFLNSYQSLALMTEERWET